MVRETYENELKELENNMVSMATMIEDGIIKAVQLLKNKDFEGSEVFIENDKVINAKRYEIEQACLITIATQQPMAGDLRLLASIIEISAELERMGDYAKGIAKINLLIGDKPFIKPLIDIPLMAEKVRYMLHRAIDAFVNRDVDVARTLPKEDDEVDHLYNLVYEELMDFIAKDKATIEQANQLLWAAHNLERVADRVTNICERTLFTVTGEMTELNYDEPGASGLS